MIRSHLVCAGLAMFMEHWVGACCLMVRETGIQMAFIAQKAPMFTRDREAIWLPACCGNPVDNSKIAHCNQRLKLSMFTEDHDEGFNSRLKDSLEDSSERGLDEQSSYVVNLSFFHSYYKGLALECSRNIAEVCVSLFAGRITAHLVSPQANVPSTSRPAAQASSLIAVSASYFSVCFQSLKSRMFTEYREGSYL